MADDDAPLRLDYEQTMQTIRMLTDVRFKLLALVPTVSALGVVVAGSRTIGDAIGIGLVGIVATFGVLIYELRNSQLYAAAMHRAAALEARLGFRRSNPAGSEVLGGQISERPHTLRLAGVLIKHDRGLALVYAAAVAGWTYVLFSAGLAWLDADVSTSALRERAPASSTTIGLTAAGAAGLLTALLVDVFDHRGDKRGPAPWTRLKSSVQAAPKRWLTADGRRSRSDVRAARRARLLIHSGRPAQVSSADARREANRPRRAPTVEPSDD